MTSREFRSRLGKRARRFEIAVPAEAAARLEAYYRLLVRWNARINLTALRLDPPDERSFDRLLIEPLVASRFLPPGTVRLMDVGSGSGSPAVPLAVVRPELTLTMVESKTRKAVFLMEVVRELSLAATVETARFEQLLSRPDLHESFDAVTVRAVRIESRTLISLQAFMKPEGQLFWFRAPGGTFRGSIPPPLRLHSVHPLIDAAVSEVAVLQKDVVGRGPFHVEPSPGTTGAGRARGGKRST